MQAIPIPPPFPIQGGIQIPDPILVQPSRQEFQWEPVPMYIEDIPPPIPTPNPSQSNENTEAEQEEEEEQEEKNNSETKEGSPEGLGKPNELTPPLNLVPELAEVQTWDVPLIGVEIPVPRAEILVTATTTAGSIFGSRCRWDIIRYDFIQTVTTYSTANLQDSVEETGCSSEEGSSSDIREREATEKKATEVIVCYTKDTYGITNEFIRKQISKEKVG